MARAIWSGSIGFGMVSIPVKLFGATESKDISFHLLHATCGTRLKQVRWMLETLYYPDEIRPSPRWISPRRRSPSVSSRWRSR
jgi:non-homologous end joining protein Ku